MSITIDGVEITGATIDGEDVQEITIDGTTVWESEAGPYSVGGGAGDVHEVTRGLESLGSWMYDSYGEVRALTTDSNGNTFVGGEGYGIHKLDKALSHQAEEGFGAYVYDIAVDSNDDIIVAGSGDEIKKYDNSLNWIASYNIYEDLKAVTTDSNGNVFAGSAEGWVYKLDSNLNQQVAEWEFDVYNESVDAIVTDSSDDVFVGGEGDFDLFKLDNDLNEDCSYYYDGPVYAITVDPDDNIFVGGDDFDCTLTKLDNNLNFQDELAANDEIRAIAIDTFYEGYWDYLIVVGTKAGEVHLVPSDMYSSWGTWVYQEEWGEDVYAISVRDV